MKALLALLAAALIAVPAAAAYRNPTPGRAVVLQIPGMHRAKVQRNIVYRTAPRLRMDVYRPRSARGLLPAVLLGGVAHDAVVPAEHAQELAVAEPVEQHRR